MFAEPTFLLIYLSLLTVPYRLRISVILVCCLHCTLCQVLPYQNSARGFGSVIYVESTMEFIKTARLMSRAQRGTQQERWSMLYTVLSHVEFVIYCIVTCGVGYYIVLSHGCGWRPVDMSVHANPHRRCSPGKAKLWVDWLDLFNAELCPKGYWRVPRSQRVCERRLYLTLHCHHHNDFALRWAAMRAVLMFSVTVEGQSHKTVSTSQFWKRRDSRSGMEPRPFCLPN